MTSRRSFIGSSLIGALVTLIPGKSLGAVSSGTKTKVCKISSIPVGGGKIVKSSLGDLLITQPQKNVFRAFSARCTHQGCTIGPSTSGTNAVSGGVVSCYCHGAQFSPTDGSAVRGPAASPLKKYSVSKDKTYIYVA